MKIYLLAILPLLLIAVLVNSCNEKQEVVQNEMFLNPVLPGDRPNPTVIKIGDSYYASATSNEWSPLFPIYKSNDLENWTLISYVFPSGAPDWALNNFWAPELSYDEVQQKLYVYYTGRSKKDNNSSIGVASADSPDGPFIDHGSLELSENGSIDPFEMRDENGKLFLIWKEAYAEGKPAIIWAQEISEDRTRMIGFKHELIRNDRKWEEHTLDGPSLFRKGKYFYLLYSAGNCCDINCDYKIGVARSQTLLGPWEKYFANPILKDNEEWKCPGTGTVIAFNDELYLLFHAYSKNGGDFLGREGVLEKINWTDDAWPVFKNNLTANRPKSKMNFEDDFSSALNPVWQWRTTQNLSYATGEMGLMLAASEENNGIGNMLVQLAKTTNYEVTAEIDLSHSGVNTSGGIALIGAANNGFGAPIAGMGISAGRYLIQVWMVNDQQTNIYEAIPTKRSDDQIRLKMQVKKGYWASFSVFNGQNWEVVADSIDASSFVPWGMGFRWGLTSKGNLDEFANIRNVKLIND